MRTDILKAVADLIRASAELYDARKAVLEGTMVDLLRWFLWDGPNMTMTVCGQSGSLSFGIAGSCLQRLKSWRQL
jgi:hypothetical protein